MKTLTRDYEATEALVTVLNKGSEYRFLVSVYAEDYSIADKFEKIAILNEDIHNDDLLRFMENKLELTNCYDLNDWEVA